MAAHLHQFSTYTLGELFFLIGSFRINGTSDPDNKRDGRSGAIATVARASAGKFTVTFADGFTLPEKLIVDPIVKLHQAANPTVWSRAHYIKDTYNYVTRSFQIQVLKATATADTADAASDADDDDTISFFAVGSTTSPGTDTTT